MAASGLLHEDWHSDLLSPLDAPTDRRENPFSHQGPEDGLNER